MMVKRKGQQQRMYVATLLLAVLLPAFIVTTFHHHDAPQHLQECFSCDVHHHHIHKHHLEKTASDSWQNCSICHFMFSPVEKARFFEVSFCHDFDSNSYSAVVTSFSQSVIRYYSLRAPPTASVLS